jgi:hypothetical protein
VAQSRFVRKNMFNSWTFGRLFDCGLYFYFFIDFWTHAQCLLRLGWYCKALASLLRDHNQELLTLKWMLIVTCSISVECLYILVMQI